MLKWTAVAVGSLALLAVAATACVVWLLSPETLTSMVERYSGEFIDGHVKARRVELTFWKTFPKVRLDVDDLTVVSDALDSITPQQRAQLPASADTLLTVSRLSGGINVWAATMGYIMLYDVEIDAPRVNLVKVDDLHANYDIVPEAEEQSDTASSPLPYISIDRFVLNGAAPVRYVSLADSIDAVLDIALTAVDGEKAPVYTISARAEGGGRLAPMMDLAPVTLGVDGSVKWDQRRPDHLRLEDFTFDIGGNTLGMNADISFSDSLLIHSLDLYAARLRVDNMMALVPEGFKGSLPRIVSDAEIDVRARLLKPYDIGRLSDSVPAMPDVEVSVMIPGGSFEYDQLKLRRVQADITATVCGGNPDGSRVDIKRLDLQGRAVGFTLNGTVTHPLSDPRVDGVFDGHLDFAALPADLLRRLPFTVRGRVDGHTDVALRLSDLDPKRFHNIRANGKVGLDDFLLRMRDSSALAYVTRAQLSFGTNTHLTTADGQEVDSLLRVSLTSDTLAFVGDGVALLSRGLKVGMGTRNTKATFDTTVITPLGFTASVRRMSLRSDSDSMRVVIRNADIKATLQRFEGGARDPLLTVGMSAGRMRYSDAFSRLALTDAKADISLHPRRRPKWRIAVSASDSLQRAARMRRMRAEIDSANAGREMMDFDVDRDLVGLMRRWSASAHIKAKRARMMTPYFPVRNRITGLDMQISTDSVVIRNTRYRMGKSDFLINGTISNITRALSSRRGSPLEMDFTIKSDTVDINNITSAILAGSAFAEKKSLGQAKAISADASDEAAENVMALQAADTVGAAFVVPSNVNARLDIDAANVLYADIWLQKLQGKLNVSDGAIHLDRLAGYTPMGSMDLTALYAGQTKHDLRFAAGMVIRRLHLKQFLHLMPEIDSILPLLREVDGIVTADAAMTTDLDSLMNMKFHTFNLVLKLSGDSLRLIDGETFRTMAKWLMFKDKKHNLIKSMQVELMVRDSRLDLFPFVFDLDRYRLGVSGGNTLDMDLDYHVAVLKSPLPFKFGINIKGKPGDLKIRLGKARFNEYAVSSSRQLTDTTRINLIHKIQEVFKFGVNSGRQTKLMMEAPRPDRAEFSVADTLTHADSVIFIQGGVLEGPKEPPFPMPDNASDTKKSSKKDKKRKK